MRKSHWSRLVMSLLLICLTLFLAGCNKADPKPAEQVDAVAAAPSKTPKPTFTPAQPTQAPVLAPAATDKPVEKRPNPTETAAPQQEKATAQPAQPTAAAPAPTMAPPAATNPPPAPTNAPATSLRMASPEYGMQAFMWWRPEVASRDLQVIKAAGFGWVKVNFGWRDIEGAGKGIYDWSRTDKIVEMTSAEQMKVLVRIDHQPQWVGGGYPANGPPKNMNDLADFFSALASRYRGRIHAYEVWNEPNLAREWGGQVPDPTGYVEMMKVSYAAIKRGDPNAIVVSAGLSPTGTWNAEARPDEWYLATMYELMPGGSNGYFDVLGAHAPGFKSPPEIDPAQVHVQGDPKTDRLFCFRHVEDLRAIMVKYGDSAKQIAVLEFGWTSDSRPDSPYNWHAVSEQTKADYLVRAFKYAKENWSPWIGLMSLIYVCDPDWTPDHEQYYWAINDPGYPDFKPRPAYNALKAMPK